LGSLRRILQQGDVARFLLAHMLYSNGINTLFSFGGIYAAGTFDMSLEEVLYFGIVLNVTAGLGAAVCLDDDLIAQMDNLIALWVKFLTGAVYPVSSSVFLKAALWACSGPACCGRR
jgi:UMF1 family MFS transporter